MNNIDKNLLESFYKKYTKDKANLVIENAIAKVGPKEASFNNEVLRKHSFQFSVETKKSSITNQKKSGRCWIFATFNVMKTKILEKLNVEDFEFSQNFIHFYDKLEKANSLFTIIIENPNLTVDSRLFTTMFKDPVSDGGYWGFVPNLIAKYGICPKSAMPETYSSSNTMQMNEILHYITMNTIVDIQVAQKESLNIEQILKIKEEGLYNIFQTLVKSLGLPPKKFTFEYRDKDKNFKKIENISPLEFLNEYADNEYLDLIDLVDDPRKEHSKNSTIHYKYWKSVNEAPLVKNINVDLEVMKAATIASLKDNKPVWFGCDVGAYSDNKTGIFDTELFNYEQTFNFKNKLTKEQRVKYFVSPVSHAMTFVGVNLDKNGKPISWEVENSWGDEVGKKGYYSMSDKWFDEYNFEVVVNKKYVDQAILEQAEKNIIELEPWDPMV
ncbi:aminopeptidase C [Mycoplasmopsis hyopharyngis]|uniref:aminopeptidase C n=1 Tax=Mycoplasmopsis hyopharyngis TaxID=29558 RepID=UPI0038733814